MEAQGAGIIFDCAHGRSHFNFRMIEKALDQDFLPDTISTDLTMTSASPKSIQCRAQAFICGGA